VVVGSGIWTIIATALAVIFALSLCIKLIPIEVTSKEEQHKENEWWRAIK
jgi:hypothetical protein